MSKAPIVFFAYKRPEHTQRSLESLSQNIGAQDSELFIYCDGIKKPEDRVCVEQVRQIVKSNQWCGTVHIIEREKNIGLANSVISGVTEICDRYGKVIVIEDDLILSTYFLEYMNTALDLYANESRFMQVSGYMFPVDLEQIRSDVVCLPFTTSWGWATWQRAWIYFDPDALGYADLKNNKKLRYKFNLNNSYQYFDMLKAQVNKKIDSWAIRWYLSTFTLNGLTLYPKNSLVRNIGFDGSGTHCDVSSNFNSEIHQNKILSIPNSIQLEQKTMDIVFSYLKSSTISASLIERVIQKIMNLYRNYIKIIFHKHI